MMTDDISGRTEEQMNRESRKIENADRLTTGRLVHFAAVHVAHDATDPGSEVRR